MHPLHFVPEFLQNATKCTIIADRMHLLSIKSQSPHPHLRELEALYFDDYFEQIVNFITKLSIDNVSAVLRIQVLPVSVVDVRSFHNFAHRDINTGKHFEFRH